MAIREITFPDKSEKFLLLSHLPHLAAASLIFNPPHFNEGWRKLLFYSCYGKRSNGKGSEYFFFIFHLLCLNFMKIDVYMHEAYFGVKHLMNNELITFSH